MLRAGWLLEMSPRKKNPKFGVNFNYIHINLQYLYMYMWLASSEAPGTACILIPKGQNKLMPPPQFPKRSCFAWLRRDSHFSRVLTQSKHCVWQSLAGEASLWDPKMAKIPTFLFFSTNTGRGWVAETILGCYCAKAFLTGGTLATKSKPAGWFIFLHRENYSSVLSHVDLSTGKALGTSVWGFWCTWHFYFSSY